MLIDVKNLYKIYNEGKENEVRALDGIDLQILLKKILKNKRRKLRYKSRWQHK